MSLASRWHRPANGPQGARAARRIRPEPEPRWAHLRSRPFLYVEPFQTGGGALPPCARGEGGVERGPTPGRPRWWLAASRLPPTGHAGDWNPGARSGLRGGEEGLTEPRAREGPPGRAGGAGARGVASATPPAIQSARLVLPGSAPLPPIPSRLLLRSCLGSPGGGTRGAAAGGSGAAVAHAPGPGEPCSCHGRSSLCCCPPLHQALKPRRPRPAVPPTPAFGFSFRQVFRVLLPLSLETVPLSFCSHLP